MEEKRFALDPLEEEQTIFSTTKVHTEVWHKRLGHFNHKVAVILQRKELAQGIPYLESEIFNCKVVNKENNQDFLSNKQLEELLENCSCYTLIWLDLTKLHLSMGVGIS